MKPDDERSGRCAIVWRSADIPVRSNVRRSKVGPYSGRTAVRKLLRTGMSALRAKQVQEGESLQVMGVSGCRFTRIKDWWRRAASSRSSSGIAGLPMSNNNEEICSSTKSFRNSVTTL